jgi:hypothetical protein
LWKLWPASIQDILRANSLIILFSVSYFWLLGKNWKWYMDFYNTLPPSLQKFDKSTVIILSVLVDIIFHLLPVIILGLPMGILSVCVATVGVLTWYFIVRHDNKIQKIYVDTVSIKTYDIVMVWGIFMAFVVVSCKNNFHYNNI